MSNVGKTLLKGHALRDEGQPAYLSDGTFDLNWRYRRTREGRAKCSCGALSEMGVTQAEAKRWHRAHKDSLRVWAK